MIFFTYFFASFILSFPFPGVPRTGSYRPLGADGAIDPGTEIHGLSHPGVPWMMWRWS